MSEPGAPLDERESDAPGRGELGLRLGHSCHRMLVWECARLTPNAALALSELLSARGYSESCRSPLVRELVHPREHSVVIVPRTGRVQIRVHYLTALEAREAAARGVARELDELVALAAEARS